MTTLLHAVQSTAGPWYVLTLGLAAAAAAVVFAGGLVAFLRRRTRSYLLVALALGALFARTAVAVCAAVGLLDPVTHHLGEHLLDAVMAGLVIAAVYYARTTRRVAA
jgi:hypothetical protein